MFAVYYSFLLTGFHICHASRNCNSFITPVLWILRWGLCILENASTVKEYYYLYSIKINSNLYSFYSYTQAVYYKRTPNIRLNAPCFLTTWHLSLRVYAIEQHCIWFYGYWDFIFDSIYLITNILWSIWMKMVIQNYIFNI